MENRSSQDCRPDQLLSVEPPGIEPATEIALNCDDTELDYAKRRESSRNVIGLSTDAIMPLLIQYWRGGLGAADGGRTCRGARDRLR